MDLLGRDLIISSSFQLFANLPSGFATWLNTLIVVYVCRNQEDAQDGLKIILIKEFMKITM
jgi:hypothetical protein